MTNNILRALWYGLTCGATAPGHTSKFNRYYKKITHLSTAYACINDIALVTLGSALKRKERLSARLGDVMSYLYMASAVLKYYKDAQEPKDDDIFVAWSLQHCLFKAQNALSEVLANFPNKILATAFKFIVFPYGRLYKKPNDRLDKKLSRALLHNEQTSQIMKRTAYIANNDDDPIGRLEIAYQAVLKASSIQKKIKIAIKQGQLPKDNPENLIIQAQNQKIITEDEVVLLQEAIKKRNQVIQVDEFLPYELGPKNAHPNWQTETKAPTENV